MATERIVHIVHVTPGESSDSVAALTQKLNDGWRLVTSAPMGGAGGANEPAQFASMVILEREDKKTVGGFLG